MEMPLKTRMEGCRPDRVKAIRKRPGIPVLKITEGAQADMDLSKSVLVVAVCLSPALSVTQHGVRIYKWVLDTSGAEIYGPDGAAA